MFWLLWTLSIVAVVRDVFVSLYAFEVLPWGELDDDVFEDMSVSFSNAAYVYFAYLTTSSILQVAEAKMVSFSARVVCAAVTALLMISGVVAGGLVSLRDSFHLSPHHVGQIIGVYFLTSSILLLVGTLAPLQNTRRIARLVSGLQFESRHPQHALTLRNLKLYVYVLSVFISLSLVQQSYVGINILAVGTDLRSNPTWVLISLSARWLFVFATLCYCNAICTQGAAQGISSRFQNSEWGSVGEGHEYLSATAHTHELGSDLTSESRSVPVLASVDSSSLLYSVAPSDHIVRREMDSPNVGSIDDAASRYSAHAAAATALRHSSPVYAHHSSPVYAQTMARARPSWSVNMEVERFDVNPHSYSEDGYHSFADD